MSEYFGWWDYDLSVDAWRALAKPADLFPPYDVWTALTNFALSQNRERQHLS
jgi:hypothetical protein